MGSPTLRNSPASARPNWTPRVTWPSCTSRHGMTRLASIVVVGIVLCEIVRNHRSQSQPLSRAARGHCVFKDDQGFTTNDEASFKTLILDENAQEGVRFISRNNQLRTYTIRVRQAR